jgi:hypothetical protein
MKRLFGILLALALIGPVTAQDNPPDYEKYRKVFELLLHQPHLEQLLRIDEVKFDYSEQKTIDGQPIKIAYYKVFVTVLAPVCVTTSSNNVWTFTSDGTRCENGLPMMAVGDTRVYTLPSMWKLTEQGWKLASKGSLFRSLIDDR